MVFVNENLSQALGLIFDIINRFYNTPVPGFVSLSVGNLFVGALVFLFGFRVVKILFMGGSNDV